MPGEGDRVGHQQVVKQRFEPVLFREVESGPRESRVSGTPRVMDSHRLKHLPLPPASVLFRAVESGPVFVGPPKADPNP